jgi:branched-chain amino acid aminotransferase
MARSANVLGLTLPYSTEELVDFTLELLRRNAVRADAYVRPLYVLAASELSVRMHNIRPSLSIAGSIINSSYIKPGGIRAMVSSWRRAPDLVLPSRAKITGSYVGPALAKTEALASGFDEALMLNTRDYVAEGTTSNIFLRRGRSWITPGPDQDILEGVTRRQVMQLILDETDSEVVQRPVERSELYVCDELLLCGTAAQIVPVIEVDRRPIGDGVPGAGTVRLIRALAAISRREDPRHSDWTTPVYGSRTRA